jgi:hypothetical protein
MGVILVGFFVVPALVGWLAVRFTKASRHRNAGVMRLATWILGVATCILTAWFLGRADEYLSEALIAGGGLALTTATLCWIRARAPHRENATG